MQVRLALYLLTIAFCASDRASEIRLLLLAALAGPLAACSASPLAVHPAFRCAFHCHARKVGFPGTQSSGSRARLSPLQRGHSAISPVSPRSLPRVSLLLVSLLTCLFSLNFQNNFSESKQFCFDLTAQVSCPAVEDSGGSPPTWGCILVSCGFRSVCSGRVSTVFIHT